MLVVLSGAIGNARVIKLKQGWTEGAAIYGAVVAEPGEKKTRHKLVLGYLRVKCYR